MGPKAESSIADRARAGPQLDVPIGRIQKLAQLEAKRDVSEMNATDYRHAWAWTHFLLHGPPEAHDELVRFLADIHNSTPPGQLSVRLEQRLPGLDKRLVAALQKLEEVTVACPRR